MADPTNVITDLEMQVHQYADSSFICTELPINLVHLPECCSHKILSQEEVQSLMSSKFQFVVVDEDAVHLDRNKPCALKDEV